MREYMREYTLSGIVCPFFLSYSRTVGKSQLNGDPLMEQSPTHAGGGWRKGTRTEDWRVIDIRWTGEPQALVRDN